MGVPFEYSSGGGVTLSNLLNGWPRNMIANAASMATPPSWDICDRFYKFGDAEFRWVFPLSRIVRPSASGPLTRRGSEQARTGNAAGSGRSLLGPGPRHALFAAAFNALGTVEVLCPARLSAQLERWIGEFRPQVALTFFSTLNSMRLTESVLERFQIPYVVLINDDWVSSIYPHGLLSPWLRKIARRTLARLLANAAATVGVSPSMCEAYAQRYDRPFHWFCGPIELDRLLPHARSNWRAGNPFRLLYAGRVGRANTNSLIEACRAVAELRRAGRSLLIDLYLTDGADRIRKEFSEDDGVIVHAAIPYEDTPALYGAADLLLLPLDFDEDSISFARYSMSTKIAEYAAAAVPILVYAPRDIAMCSYATQDKWAYVVSQRSQAALQEAIVRLAGDEALRENLGRQALHVARRDHDAATVRERFRALLSQAARAGTGGGRPVSGQSGSRSRFAMSMEAPLVPHRPRGRERSVPS
jgi:glycosyltransferase involved in cell wall biosynthesis